MIFCIITTLPPTEEFVNTKIGLLRDPEHRPTEIGVVLDGARAAVRTAVLATRRGPDAVDERPRRGRDITPITPIRGIICCLAPTILSIPIAWGARFCITTICTAAFRHAFYCAIAECYRPFTIIQITAVFGPKFIRHCPWVCWVYRFPSGMCCIPRCSY